MRYYNRTNTCDRCGDKLIPRRTVREYNKEGNWTGNWLCSKCNMKGYTKIPGSRDVTYYNRTNTCDMCGGELISGKTYKEYNKEGNWTGKWLCKKCYSRDHDKRVDSSHNIMKSVRNFRTGNLDPSTETGKGYIGQQITCKARKVDDLNIRDDSFHSPIDHSRDDELGIIQSKLSVYNSTYKRWNVSNQTEQGKEFDNLIIYCMSEDMQNVERVYIIPRMESVTRVGISIYKNSTLGWYEKYRVDEKPYNDAYHSLSKDDLSALR